MAARMASSMRVFMDGFRRSSADLVIVASTLIAIVLAVSLDAPTVVRAPLAFVVVFIIPGYTLALALFPVGESSLGASRQEPTSGPGISVLDRLVLTIGLSLSLVVLIGLVIEMLPVPIATETLLEGLVVVTGGLIPVAYYRREGARSGERYAPFSASDSQTNGSSRSFGFDALSVLLAMSILFAGVAVAYSAGMADNDTGVTEFYFLTESDDGELQPSEYPTNFTVSQGTELTVAVGNREGKRVNYSIVGQLQKVDKGSETIEVRERSQVFAANVPVGVNDTRTVNTTVTPQATGEYRLIFFLYQGDAPEQPRQENAYREIHLWISVNEPATETSQ